MSGEVARYRLGPRSTRGLVAGWRPRQIASVAVGALLALGFVRSVGGVAGVGCALMAAGAGIAVATWPIAGRPIESWVPTVVSFAAAHVADGRGLPWLPEGGGRRGSAAKRSGPVRRLLLCPPDADGGGTIGIVEDQEASTWSAALPVGSPGFALLDEAGRAAALSAWSGVLAAMAAEGRSLHRLQWIARTFPSGAGVEREAPGSGDYGGIVDELTPELSAREVLVVVTTEAPRRGTLPRPGGRRAGGQRAADPAAARERLAALTRSLGDRLAGAGLSVGDPLGPAELAAAVHRAYDVSAGAGYPDGWPWPVGVEAEWEALRTDATWHATYWVSEWPRGEVGPGVLLPLLVGGVRRRTVSLTMAPLPPMHAVRRAERERTAGAADAELRVRHGYSLTARARAEQDGRLQREAELAEGHAAYLFSGYVAVTAADRADLEAACDEVEQSAALAQLELRRLYGTQESAWCCTLPTGRGCG